MKNIIKIENLIFSYGNKKPIININSLEIQEGEKILLSGSSGCGKTTLLSLISGILLAKNGSLKIFDTEFVNQKSSVRDHLRTADMGFIFQMFNLIPYLNVLENILLPCQINSKRRKSVSLEELTQEAMSLCGTLGISKIINKNVTQISIGQQQRVSAARALLGKPKLIIADEPTSALDHDNKEIFIQELKDQCKKNNTTLIFVSHDNELHKYFDKHLHFSEINKV